MPVRLPPESPALRLLQRLRDEAHRFAVTYHRTLRDRRTTASALDEIEGIGPATKRKLLAAFKSIEALSSASLEDLEGLPGMGRATALKVYRHYHGR
jgi:excinuclease ABC subunit C